MRLKIYKNVAGIVEVQFVDEDNDRYFSLANATNVIFTFRMGDNTTESFDLSSGVTISDAASGIVKWTYTAAIADRLKLGTNLSFYASIITPDLQPSVQFLNILDVLELKAG